MKKNLNIDPYIYPDGFLANQINCIDLAIACAAGHLTYNNYYYYVFYYVLFNNWYDKLNISTTPKIILKKIGLYPKIEYVYSEDELIKTIKKHLEDNNPVLIPTTYYSLFYSRWTYLENSSSGVPHLIIIDGYDDDKKVLIIRDTIHVAQAGLPKFDYYEGYQSVGFFKLQLTEEMVQDIWKRSNNDLKSSARNKLITIHENNETIIKYSFTDIIEDFIVNFITKNNKLIDFINAFEVDLDSSSQEIIRNHFYSCLKPFFKIIYKVIIQLKLDASVLEDYEEIRVKYSQHRDKITAILIKYIIQKKQLKKQKKEIMIKEIIKNDMILAKFIDKNIVQNIEYKE